MNDPARKNDGLRAAIDRYGAELKSWPDRLLAGEVGRAALADRSLRAYLDDTRVLEAALTAERDRLDAEIKLSGSAARIAETVLGRRRPVPRSRWIAVAAGLVVAAVLGGTVDLRLNEIRDRDLDIVMLDPLVFGPTQADEQ